MGNKKKVLPTWYLIMARKIVILLSTKHHKHLTVIRLSLVQAIG